MHCKRIIKTEKDLQIRKRIKNWSLSFPVYTQLKMIQNHLLNSNGYLAPIYFVLEICYFFSWNTCLLWAFYNNVSISTRFFLSLTVYFSIFFKILRHSFSVFGCNFLISLLQLFNIWQYNLYICSSPRYRMLQPISKSFFLCHGYLYSFQKE